MLFDIRRTVQPIRSPGGLAGGNTESVRLTVDLGDRSNLNIGNYLKAHQVFQSHSETFRVAGKHSEAFGTIHSTIHS